MLDAKKRLSLWHFLVSLELELGLVAQLTLRYPDHNSMIVITSHRPQCPDAAPICRHTGYSPPASS